MPILPRPTVDAQTCAPAAVAHLRTYIDLNAHVIAEGLDGIYRLWLLARSLDPDGRGVVDLDAFLATMQGFDLNRLHLRRGELGPQTTPFFFFFFATITKRLPVTVG